MAATPAKNMVMVVFGYQKLESLKIGTLYQTIGTLYANMFIYFFYFEKETQPIFFPTAKFYFSSGNYFFAGEKNAYRQLLDYSFEKKKSIL